MAYRLRTGLTFCSIGDRCVFLDVPQNRYFLLKSGLDHPFRALLAGEAIPAREVTALHQAGVVEEAEVWQRWQPDLPFAPRWTSKAIRHGECTAFDVAWALVAQHRARRRLVRISLAQELEGLTKTVGTLPIAAPAPLSPGGTVIRAFERSKLFKSPLDLCLPRSIAIVRCLAQARVRARLVIGVKLAPFAAHAWAQANDDILNDTFEEVAKYTPILAL